MAWAQGVAGSGEHLLALLVLAKCFGRLGFQAMLGHASINTAARYFRSGSAENAAVIERIFDH